MPVEGSVEPADRGAPARIGPASQLAETVEGRLDAVEDGRAIGWAWCPTDASRKLSVVTIIDGRPVSESVADKRRSDLAAAGKGDGAHGFGMALPESLADGGSHTVEVLAGAARVPLPAALGFSVDAQSPNPFAGTAFHPVDRQDRELGSSVLDAPALPIQVARVAAGTLRARNPRTAIALLRGIPSRLPTMAHGAVWLLGAGCAFYFLLFVYLTRHHGFFQDEWELLLDRRGWNAGAFLSPHVQSLLLIPILVYKLLFVTVGVQSTWPYRLPGFALHVLCVVGLYVLARRRSGAWLALVPAGLLLVLGAGWEDELWAMQMTFLTSIAAGTWALICLECGDRRGDGWAAGLVMIAVASSSVGLPFAVAIGAGLALSGWRRLWIAVVPLLLYLLWFSHYGQSAVVWSNAIHVPGYDLRIGGYGFAGLLGLSSLIFGTGGVPLVLGIGMLLVTVVWLVRRAVRTWPLPPLAVTGIVGALALWTATALARYQYGQPDSSQYVYPSAVFILVTLIAFMQWRRISVRVAIIIAAAGAVIAAFGLAPLRQYAIDRDGVDARVNVAFGAAQLAGSAGDPAYLPDSHHLSYVTLGGYMKIVHDLGSPAYSVSEIQHHPIAYQLLADQVLIGAERIAPIAAAEQVLRGAQCSATKPAAFAGFAAITVPPGHKLYVSAPAGTRLGVSLRRLSPSFPTPPQETVVAGHPVSLTFPLDLSTIPWHVEVAESQSGSTPARARGCIAILP